MAYTPEEESIVINLITRIDQKYKAQAEKALDDLVKRAENSIASDITKALNDRIRNKQQAIANELKLEDQRRAKELAGLKADIMARSKAESELQQLKLKQAQETNRRILLDSEKTRQAELAGLKADIMARSAINTKGIGAGGADIQASGAYSSLTTGRTTSDRTYSNYVAQAKTAEQELRASANRVASDQARAAKEAERAWSKTFMGAIEGGTTFGHKLATTFQYATAGTAFYALAGSISAMTTAFLDADKAMHMFRGVLEMSVSDARNLQAAVFDIGTTYGGSLQDLNGAALALGRAGIETNKLGEALKSVSQLSLISGESMDTVTGVLVSWQSLYPDKTIGELGDIIVKMANDTKASVADFSTMSTYILTAGQQAGVTTESLGALAAGMRQIGKGSSTSGTELRRFFNQLSTGSEDVRKAFTGLGINMEALKNSLLKGGKESDKAMQAFFHTIKNADASKLEHISEVLDKATLKSLLAIAKASKDGKPLFDALLESAYRAQGASAKAADEVALSFSVAIEKIKNSMFEQANVFGQAFTDTLFDNQKVGEFDAYIKELTSDTGLLNKTMHNLGVMLGFVVDHIDSMVIAYTAFKAVTMLSGVTTAVMGIATATNVVTAAIVAATAKQALFNAVAKVNPWIAVATAIAGGVTWLYEYNRELDKVIAKKNSLKANTTFGNIKAEITGMSREQQIQRIQERSAELYLSEIQYIKERDALLAKGSLTNKEKQQLEYRKRQIAIIKETQPLLQKQLNAVVKARVLEKELADAPVPNVAGVTPPEQKNPTQGQIDRDAQQRIDALREEVLANEQLAFVALGITTQYEQQKYHLEHTVPELEKIAKMTVDKEKREGEIAKVAKDKASTELSLLKISTEQTLDTERRLSALRLEEKLVGVTSQKAKERLSYEKQLLTINEQYSKDLKEGKDPEEAIRIRAKSRLLATKQFYGKSAESSKSDVQAAEDIRESTKRAIEDRRALTEYEQYRLGLIREAEDIEKQYNRNREKGLDITETEKANLEKANSLRKQGDYATYVGMTLQKSLQSELNSGLMDFFDIQSEGWMDFERLGMRVLNNILQQMLQMQIVQPMATAGSSLLGDLGKSAMTWLMSANGNVFDQGHVKAYAKGGTFTNSIVRKPTYFASGGTLGVMGESGPEAILKLKRNSKGELGVISQESAGGVQSIQVNIKNESGEALAVTQSEAKTDMSGMVIDIIIDAVARNKKGMRDIIKGGR